ncbi:TPA: hypothetical protein MH254_28075, partial [Klebsiella pneumoniae]|nr:hypothetical protein [Klebsiella pneumoniae subsp. pneumoniae]HBX4573263.1 hypothetical protein [Klebsiella pneumoniae]
RAVADNDTALAHRRPRQRTVAAARVSELSLPLPFAPISRPLAAFPRNCPATLPLVLTPALCCSTLYSA